MQRVPKIAIVGLFILVLALIWRQRIKNLDRVESRETSTPHALLAATGRVEGRQETISLGAAADGIVKEVLVSDGQTVAKGTLLAEISCDDISAEIDLAGAQADSARQARIRLLRGRRDEERKAAAEQTDAAKAVLMQAREHLERSDALYQQDAISLDVFALAKRDLEVAEADYQRSLDEQHLVNAGPLPEEISRADAEVTAAQRNIDVVTHKMEKCKVRAPISGTVLKVLTKVGESYSTLLPHPLFTFTDESVRRVRAEVDERDIGKVKLGQASFVTADAFPGRRFNGQVIEISHAMEPKAVLTDDPSQKIDRDVLHVIIQLESSGADLPLGLRVTAQMTSATSPLSSMGSSNPSKVPLIPPTKAVPGSGFVLQLGAMTHRKNADALAGILLERGFPGFVLERDGDPFYRVDVGPYQDLKSARVVEDELNGGGFGIALERRQPESTR